MLKNNFTAVYLSPDGKDHEVIHLSNFDTKESLLEKAKELTPKGKELVKLLYQGGIRGTSFLWDKQSNEWEDDVAEEAFWAKK